MKNETESALWLALAGVILTFLAAVRKNISKFVYELFSMWNESIKRKRLTNSIDRRLAMRRAIRVEYKLSHGNVDRFVHFIGKNGKDGAPIPGQPYKIRSQDAFDYDGEDVIEIDRFDESFNVDEGYQQAISSMLMSPHTGVFIEWEKQPPGHMRDWYLSQDIKMSLLMYATQDPSTQEIHYLSLGFKHKLPTERQQSDAIMIANRQKSLVVKEYGS